ncbi:hypothetical protein GIB67_036594 [Kingdonia uniflora]|uniref:Pentatricopeptide repeat-containing protein n=1 Tax=Kingdonia uniflora TaxID=39325 RepID=A0A7J7MET6_9MAGN|nr:hypothetical protein GIB67_036594 [Kingdonia uniflora]
MPVKNIVSWTAFLTAYAQNGEIGKARKVFDEMPQKSVATWNAMITGYVRNGYRVDEGYELFCGMPERNAVSYAVMITGFVRTGRLSVGKRLYSEMPESWRDPVASNALMNGYLKMGELEEGVRVFEGMVERDVVSWSSMIDGYCKKGRIAEARELFENAPERNVVSWTAMIDGYLKVGQWDFGFELFTGMRRDEHVKLNSTTLTVIIEACPNLREGIQVHGLVLSMGFENDVFLCNSIVTMYCRFGCMDAANKIFGSMNKKDLVSWNSMIAGYVQNNGIQEAYTLFKKMPERDTISWTTMVVGFSNKGRMKESIGLFNEMPRKDDVAWTAIISGFLSNGGYKESFQWFIQMVREAVRPNAVTLSSLLSASSGLGVLNKGQQIHAHVVKMDMELEISVQNSLVSMYAKCGNIGGAYSIFTSIDAPNVVSMNSMITGFAQHGFGNEALELFRKMQVKGYEPNEITFLGVLSACVHVGLVEEGWDYFRSMTSVYQIEPGPDHYACMVDLLGRAGLLKEARDLIHSMSCNPHSGVWGALLSASSMYMNLDLAKLAAEHLFELEPDSATPYVVLSNIYSIAGLRENEDELRMSMKTQGVKKNPGRSWITRN